MSPLCTSVCMVIGLCANKQMRRVAARRVIAVMTDDHAFGYGATVRKLPRETMCVTDSPNGVIPQRSVATGYSPRCPFPAIVGAANIDTSVEAIFGWSLAIAVTHQEALWLACD